MRVQLMCFVLMFGSMTSGSSTIKQLHIVFRHGERAPTETYSNDPYINMSWSGGWGGLTNRGKYQMYSLGLKLKKHYNNSIPEYYFPEDVKVLSSYSDRCLMSAEALLAALFPPKGKQIWNKNLLWQPIPVHYVPRNQDNLIAMKAACKNYDNELASVLTTGEIKQINEENAELYEYLSLHTGEKIDSIGAVELLFNTLEIQLLNNLTLPEWTNKISLDRMKILAARSLRSFTETDFMKRMKGGVFLKHVISTMENPEKQPFLHLYAGHDLTLVNILNTLGYSSQLKPGFGASLVLQINNKSEIQMEYRNDVESSPEDIVLKSCPSPCKLTQFKEAMHLYIPENWEAECNQ